MTGFNRRHLGGIILAAGAATTLVGCSTLAASQAQLEGDIAATVADAVAAAKAAASAVVGETKTVVTAISATPAGIVAGWQQILGLAEQALLALASAVPLVAAIEGAIATGTEIVSELPGALADATQLASTLGALTTATTDLRNATVAAGAFTVTA